MSSDIAISVKNLTKTYRIFGHPGDRIKQVFTLGRVKFHKEFTALKDVSFEIKKGETVGIIGRNGSGKSTLLQLICGILKPTSGSVTVNGRISALLELGSGFNPEFTGRENAYFQGILMGFSYRQMEDKINDIEAFADIGEFIEQPVRTYSSGMFVRLAFAVATSMAPDILIIDEALAVGDVIFQHKTKKRLQEMVDNGVSLLLVSHDRGNITALCDRSLMLNQGNIMMDGMSSAVFDYYHAYVAAKTGEQVISNSLKSGRSQIVSGTGEARIENIRLLDSNNREVSLVGVGSCAKLEFTVRVNAQIPKLVLGFSIRDVNGQTVFGTNTNSFEKSPIGVNAGSQIIFSFTFEWNVGVGSYSISTALVSTNDRFSNNYECRELAFFFEVSNFEHPNFGGSAWLNPKLSIRALQ